MLRSGKVNAAVRISKKEVSSLNSGEEKAFNRGKDDE
jgi:hypothetical protein